MRNNQPVTQKEYVLPEGFVLVSHTDLHGNITYANEAFVEVSGYSYEELMSQPHNLLRHPDVPEQVFADFWATIKEGRPWRQIVKNRRKNGDHYWVEANATPILEKGEIVGYMSVRTPAKREQIKAAEAAYAAVAAKKIKLRYGEVDSLWGRINIFAHWPPLVTLIPSVVFALITEIYAAIYGYRPGFLNDLVIFMVLLSTVHVVYFLHRIQDAIKAVDDIAEGNLSGYVKTHGANSSGTINRRIKTLQIRLGAQMNDVLTQGRRSARLEAGLDNLNANMMLADQTGTIVYFNQSLKNYLRQLEPAIQKEIPDFVLDKLYGKPLGCLFEKNMHILEAVYHLTRSEVFKFEFFGAQLQLQITPIVDVHSGNKLGVVIEWQDIFQELFVQENIKKLVQDAKQGRLHSRVDTTQLTGFYRELTDEINGLIDNLQQTLKDISILIGGLSTKDLTLKAQGDHFGQYGWTIKNLTEGIHALRESFCRVNNQAEEVNRSAQHVSESNEELSTSIKNQARELQKTAQAMRQLTQKVNETAQQASNSNQLALQTRTGVEQGNQTMQEAIQAMSEIGEVSSQITNIVTLIDSIAFQTNLLALNAAVEAARAGEHGRGFAVVAGEVRTLAQKSADAARDIKALIDMTSDKIAQGTEKVQATGESLTAIIGQVRSMSENISMISDNAQAQSQQINEVNRSIISLDDAAKNNATLVMENASLAEYLGDVANSLDELVGNYDLGDCEVEQAATAKEETQGALVLVVDDNISNLKVATMLLKKHGFATKTASNGREAVSQCKRYQPSVILMDIEMPLMDGLQATRELRASGYKQPIIAYTGHGDEFSEQTQAAGMNALLNKPLQPQEMIALLKELNCQPNTRNNEVMKLRRAKLVERSAAAKQFQQMIEAHLGWKRKIRSFIDGADIGVTYERAINDKACALGEWLFQGAGQQMMNLPLMQELVKDHAQMHATIKVVMDSFALDDYETMEQAVVQIDALSEKVVSYLNQLIDMQG